MKILDRMTLMLRADAHGVMDQLEERSLLLKQHLREAEAELSRKRALAASLAEEEQTLNSQLEGLNRELEALDSDVDLALAEGKDELARFAVRRLLPKREAGVRIGQRLQGLAEERQRIEERLESQSAEFDQLKRRVRARLAAIEEQARNRANDGWPDAERAFDHRGSDAADEEVELEILRRRTATAQAGEGA